MTVVSSAIGSERISKVVGYIINKGDFSTTSPNLPQRIAVLGEANTANQAALDVTPKEILSAKQAGTLYGFGSPLYNIMRILRPLNGGGIGGIPVICYPQAVAVDADAAARDITPTGTATGNGLHTVTINGRGSVDGQHYDYAVVVGDTPALIVAKITDAINNVIGAPVIAVDATTKVTATCKWKGLTSEQLTITIDTNDNACGITYAVTSAATGLKTPSIAAALELFGDNWNTLVINSYGEPVLDDLEEFNGIPDPDVPTGRYQGLIMKPFISLFGETSDTYTDYVDATGLAYGREEEVTNAICPAPGSAGWNMEAAANVAVLFARKMQDTPHLDINSQAYPDMPTPADGDIGDFADYNTRDYLVKHGSSTVTLNAGQFTVEDFVTTYCPDGEIPPQFRYCRNLMLDFNVRFGYYLLEQINVVDHTIAADADTVTATKIIKPKQWKLIINKYAEDLAKRALIADAPFMQSSITVGINPTNPDRLDTTFSYKRTGVARISSTTATAGFNFGTI